MAFYRVLGVAVLGSASMLGSASLLSGCGAFFVCEGKSDCPVTNPTNPTNAGDFVYVSNSTSGSDYISGYSLSGGALTAISGADINLGFTPVAMVVSPSNGFLYVASDGSATNPGVYVYSINSSGVLTEINNLDPLSNDVGIVSMDMSPDGNYLFTLSAPTLSAETILNEYQIDSTTGLPTVDNPTQFQAAIGTACSITNSGAPLSQLCTVKVSPNKDYVAVALAGTGFTVFPYTSSGGITSATVGVQQEPALSSTSGDFSLAFDKNNYLYVASTDALTPYSGLGGTLTQGTSYVYTANGGDDKPRSVTVTSNSGFVYTANEDASTISGFSLSGTGGVTSLGNGVPGPTNVSALSVDNSGKYLVAAGYNTTNGLQVFTISSTGVLTAAGTPVGTAAYSTAAPVPVVMALSH